MTGNIIADVVIIVFGILVVVGGLSLGWDREKTDRAAREFYEREA